MSAPSDVKPMLGIVGPPSQDMSFRTEQIGSYAPIFGFDAEADELPAEQQVMKSYVPCVAWPSEMVQAKCKEEDADTRSIDTRSTCSMSPKSSGSSFDEDDDFHEEEEDIESIDSRSPLSMSPKSSDSSFDLDDEFPGDDDFHGLISEHQSRQIKDFVKPQCNKHVTVGQCDKHVAFSEEVTYVQPDKTVAAYINTIKEEKELERKKKRMERFLLLDRTSRSMRYRTEVTRQWEAYQWQLYYWQQSQLACVAMQHGSTTQCQNPP
jgi:hypothetical protein